MDWDDLSKSELALWFDSSGGEGDLYVEAVHGGFRGQSFLWIRSGELRSFAEALNAVIEGGQEEARLEAGPSNPYGDTVSLRTFPLGPRGHLAIDVALTDPELHNERPHGRNRLTLRLITQPAPLGRFAQQLRRLAEGEREDVRLQCN